MAKPKAPGYVIVNDDEDITPGVLDGARMPEQELYRSRTTLEAAVMVRVGSAPLAERWVVISIWGDVVDAEIAAERMPADVHGRLPRVAWMELAPKWARLAEAA